MTTSVHTIKTLRAEISLAGEGDALELRRYYLRNAKHLAPWEPIRGAGYHELSEWEKRTRLFAAMAATGSAYRYVARPAGEQSILAIAGFANVVRGAFQACHLGYSIDAEGQGRGLMFEILSALIPHVFEHYGLHRIMANYLPENHRSARLLERLGFQVEGRAKDYLFIAGRWRDHILTSRTNPALACPALDS